MFKNLAKFAIIVGSAYEFFVNQQSIIPYQVETPYGSPSSPLMVTKFAHIPVVLLARHAQQNNILPHQINYKANLWALKQVGVEQIIALATVGGIREDMFPGQFSVPDQIIDYTYGRHISFFEDQTQGVRHIDFTYPYCESLRQMLLQTAQLQNFAMVSEGVYGATQGPRLETAAEIRRMQQEGCTMVGMTGMPEASLAKEFELCYACLALVVNWAAGKAGNQIISMPAIHHCLENGMKQLVPFWLELFKGLETAVESRKE